MDKSAALKHEFTIVANIPLHVVLITFTRDANPIFASHLSVKHRRSTIYIYQVANTTQTLYLYSNYI